MTNSRNSPFEIDQTDFRTIGHQLVDSIADFLSKIGDVKITPGETPLQVQKLMGNPAFPIGSSSVVELFSHTSDLLLKHSLFNGHPKFFGYITGSPAPVGILSEMLAATINPNCGAQILSPVATEIEKQVIRWLAEFVGVSPGYGGILVSGGNMANLTAFLAGRTAMLGKQVKTDGLRNGKQSVVYCSKTTHTWIEKAANLFGFGTNSIRWIQTDENNKMSGEALEQAINADFAEGLQPMMVIGTAGDVSTGVVDDLSQLSMISKKYKLWFHVDGAYGIPAAVLPELKEMFKGIEEADSIALDPHKWLYSPLEAGCTLVKNPAHLSDTYSSHPDYYNFNTSGEGSELNFYEYGFQNSRGFRALKVWMMLQHVGKQGYIESIREDVELARLMYELAEQHPELDAVTHNLSITTLRFVPIGYEVKDEDNAKFLNRLNETLLNRLQVGGKVFFSNALVKGEYCLRACIVNFRTSRKDIQETIEIVVREGRSLASQ